MAHRGVQPVLDAPAALDDLLARGAAGVMRGDRVGSRSSTSPSPYSEASWVRVALAATRRRWLRCSLHKIRRSSLGADRSHLSAAEPTASTPIVSRGRAVGTKRTIRLPEPRHGLAPLL